MIGISVAVIDTNLAGFQEFSNGVKVGFVQIITCKRPDP